jgi:hypothetical protein
MQDANYGFVLVMFFVGNRGVCLSRWLRCVRPSYASARLLRLRLRILLGARLSICCECCCQIEVSAMGQSLVQRSPLLVVVYLSVIMKP